MQQMAHQGTGTFGSRLCEPPPLVYKTKPLPPPPPPLDAKELTTFCEIAECYRQPPRLSPATPRMPFGYIAECKHVSSAFVPTPDERVRARDAMIAMLKAEQATTATAASALLTLSDFFAQPTAKTQPKSAIGLKISTTPVSSWRAALLDAFLQLQFPLEHKTLHQSLALSNFFSNTTNWTARYWQSLANFDSRYDRSPVFSITRHHFCFR